MGFKPIIRNEHRESFAAGRLDEIPAEALRLLQEQAASQPPAEGGEGEGEELP